MPARSWHYARSLGMQAVCSGRLTCKGLRRVEEPCCFLVQCLSTSKGKVRLLQGATLCLSNPQICRT